jgi:membrane protein required for beta-lactamase induction
MIDGMLIAEAAREEYPGFRVVVGLVIITMIVGGVVNSSQKIPKLGKKVVNLGLGLFLAGLAWYMILTATG